MSDRFCIGRYRWIDRLYADYLKENRLSQSTDTFKQFYLELEKKFINGEIELAAAGGDIRERMAKQRGMLDINKTMEQAFKQLLSEGKIKQVKWMYMDVSCE